MAFTEDMSVFFGADMFGTEATWVPPGGAPKTANVIIDMPTEDLLGGRVASNEYVFVLPSTDFMTIKRGESVTISAGEYAGIYSVREVKFMADGRVKTLSVSKV